MRLQGHAQLQQPQAHREGEARETGQPAGGAGQLGGGERRHRQDPFAAARVRARRLPQDGREVRGAGRRRAQGAGDVQQAVRARRRNPGELRQRRRRGDRRQRDVPHRGRQPGTERRLDVRPAGQGERAQGHQRTPRKPLVARPLQHVRRLPRVHRQHHVLPIPQIPRPHPGHQALLRPHRHQPEVHHRPVLRPVRELLGHRETGPGPAGRVERMPVDDPLFPRPVVLGPRLPLAVLARSRQRQRRHAVPEFGGEGRGVRYGEVRHQPRRIVVRPLVEPYDGDVRAGRVRIRPRAVQPATVRQMQGQPVPTPLPAGDPGQRIMGETAPQARQDGRPGAGQFGVVPRQEAGPYDGQFLGDLGLCGGGTVHGRAPRVRIGRHSGTATTAY